MDPESGLSWFEKVERCGVREYGSMEVRELRFESKSEELELSEKQLLELDKRLEKYERGQMKFSS